MNIKKGPGIQEGGSLEVLEGFACKHYQKWGTDKLRSDELLMLVMFEFRIGGTIYSWADLTAMSIIKTTRVDSQAAKMSNCPKAQTFIRLEKHFVSCLAINAVNCKLV